MPNRKKLKSAGEKSHQKQRTHANKVLKYIKLINENRSSPHRKFWEKQIEYFKNN